MTFQTERPIYVQLMDEIRGQIAAGRLAPGGKIDSIRDLAAFYAVNPNTVQRALAELERDGLLSTRRANGKTVTEDAQVIRELRARLASERLEALLSAMESLGFSAGETRDLFDRAQKARLCRNGGSEITQGGGS
ncbi:MAG: GntR family transcriptional regulator [Treponema sp.]|jgi:DNA-binding transcriptional regulator YhcF (GntR family)|nr:GntR family transcriptional regulator [Treponema sp.]